MVNIVTIKFDVSGTDPGAAGVGEQPKPGIYTGQIHEIKHRTERGQGKEDDLEVIYRILKDDGKPDGKYSRVWDYVGLSAPQTEWKRAQFFEAIGEAGENKREGSFNPSKHAEKFNDKETGNKGTKVKIRIKGDSYQGEYKGKVAAVLPLSKDAPDAKGEAGGGLFDDEDEPEKTEAPAGKTEAKGDSEDHTYESVSGMKIAELRELADNLGVDSEGKRKSEVRDEILDELGITDEEDEDAPF